MPLLTHPNFIQPRYDSGGFASLPLRVRDLLIARKYDAVVLLLADGFGWRFVEKFQEEPFFKKLRAMGGEVAQLTSQFPSTTAAHVTTLHTGLTVGEHGLVEWNLYEPALDAVITPLLFSFAGTTERDTLKPAGVKPQNIYPPSTLYQPLKKQGVASTVLQHREYTPSTYSDAMFRGAEVRSYKSFAEALVNLDLGLSASALSQKEKPPSYFVVYYDKVDSISHDYGPDSPQTSAEVRVFLLMLEHLLLPSLARHPRTLFLLTADHGQTETDPATTIYINRDTNFKGIEKMLKTDHAGRPIVPCGSCRDFFLHIQPGRVDEAQEFLSARLQGKAEVQKVTDLIEAGFFGPTVSPGFRSRAGDLVILPFRGESVWWYEKDKFEQKFHGHHGGLTKQEMEIPLITSEML
jgi:Type I phosphodiesterase / nucleotide pyrophosphatase